MVAFGGLGAAGKGITDAADRGAGSRDPKGQLLGRLAAIAAAAESSESSDPADKMTQKLAEITQALNVGIPNIDKVTSIPPGNVDPRNELEKAFDFFSNNPVQSIVSSLVSTAIPAAASQMTPEQLGLGSEFTSDDPMDPSTKSSIAGFFGINDPVAGHTETPSTSISAVDPTTGQPIGGTPGVVDQGVGGADFVPQGLSLAIQSFLGGGAAPEVDSMEALRALEQAITGVARSESDFLGRDLTGQGFADPARTELQSIFDALTPGDDIASLLSELGGFNLGRETLGTTQEAARASNVGAVNTAFGEGFAVDAFQPIDDSIIQSILDERRGPAESQISNAAARGTLSEAGALSANQLLGEQEETGRTRLSELGSAVTTGSQGLARDISRDALSTASGFSLGDEPFDISSFTSSFEDLQAERIGGQRENITNLLGGEPLFNAPTAIRGGGTTQGLVSGASPGESFLDAIAARELAATRDKRGLGTKGSGTF